jgi:hypothetical protein
VGQVKTKAGLAANSREWTRIGVEFVALESLIDVNGCDMIICWKHNWPECPLEVVELSKLFGKQLTTD